MLKQSLDRFPNNYGPNESPEHVKRLLGLYVRKRVYIQYSNIVKQDDFQTEIVFC